MGRADSGRPASRSMLRVFTNTESFGNSQRRSCDSLPVRVFTTSRPGTATQRRARAWSDHSGDWTPYSTTPGAGT
jgi:hypothetical protein